MAAMAAVAAAMMAAVAALQAEASASLLSGDIKSVSRRYQSTSVQVV
jgi:hypothetical protein